MSILYLVVPCYNEEEVLPETSARLTARLDELIGSGRCSGASRILFVDDGSTDKTWSLICSYHERYERVCGLKLAHNRGHQNALLAGLMTAREYCDVCISLDADLQDDIGVLDKFLDEYHKGFDVVYGVRSARKSDSFFKKSSARSFYRLMRFLGADVVYDHADYRLMSRRALDALSEHREVNLFLRGLVPAIGFPSTIVYYERAQRMAGESKYPLRKMLAFAFDGITSFSVRPLRIITALGVVVSILSVAALLYALVSKIVGAQPGWTAIVGSIWLIGGIQLFSLGIIGEYIGKIYSETKARPKYVVEEFLK